MRFLCFLGNFCKDFLKKEVVKNGLWITTKVIGICYVFVILDSNKIKMAKRKRKKKEEKDSETKGDTSPSILFWKNLKDETAQSIWAIFFFVIAIFLILSAIGLAGMVGEKVYGGLSFLMGVGYFLTPVLFIILSIAFFSSLRKDLMWAHAIGGVVFFVSGLGLVELLFRERGGLIGGGIANPLISLFDVYASGVFLIASLIVSIIVIFDIPARVNFFSLLGRLFKKKENEEEGAEDEISDQKILSGGEPIPTEDLKASEASAPPPPVAEKPEEKPKDELPMATLQTTDLEPYEPPPLSLLNKDQGKPGVGDIKANANIIKRTLQNFGVVVEMDEVSIGPTVTRYALKPAEGVKLSRIVGLQNDLSLALAAHPIRIEAPIPGKSLVGIEIPNSQKTLVGLGTLLSSNDFQKSPKPLLIGIGKDITGNHHYGSVSKMPHILIAGATGSGKSVTIHSLVTSLLYRNSPETLKFIMVDPKRVELTLYNSIPHLLTPVITNAKNAILALKWAIKEMDRRYDILEAEQVRDIDSYHKNIVHPEIKKRLKKKGKKKDKDSENQQEEPLESMPYIVIVIDELADIMQTYPREMEAAVVRLAQMSRAVGIHLVLSTQRPSVNVITGLIKANIPARIALQVASQVDSRTILDTGGAEKLLGAGDMLYLSGEMGKPRRLQSAFISEDEVKEVVKHFHKHYDNFEPSEIDFSKEKSDSTSVQAILGTDEDEDEDELFEEARNVVVSSGIGSTSLIQRKLRVGYARAGRLMDILEKHGVVGPPNGSKPREVLVGNETGFGDSETKNSTDDLENGDDNEPEVNHS